MNYFALSQAVTLPNPWSIRRFKLTSQRFFNLIDNVRSFLKFAAVASNPDALHLLRQLLWAESLPADAVGGKDSHVVRKLCSQGQIVLGPDDRWAATGWLGHTCKGTLEAVN
jgi:hypothetical protein